MAGSLSYADALRLLGHDGPLSGVVKAVGGTGAEAIGVPGLGALGGLLIAGGADAVREVRERLAGISRMDRTRRIAAAHAIIVVGAFFEALEEVLGEADPPVRMTDLDLGRAEQVRLATGGTEAPDGYSAVLAQLLDSPIPLPAPHRPFEDNLDAVGRYYLLLAVDVTGYLRSRGPAPLDVAAIEVHRSAVADRAAAKYAVRFRELMVDVPEFAAWSGQIEHQATRSGVAEISTRLDEIGIGLAGLGQVLARMPAAAVRDDRRAQLTALYRAGLDLRVLAAGDVPAGLRLPTLGDSYLDPRGRLARVRFGDLPSSDTWWEQRPVREDLATALAGLFTSPDAAEVPIVVLGHPGAGKSKLTEILAARLAGEDFLPVRVELRSVPANAPVQDQIEHGIRAALGESVSWPELVRSARGALPVVLLDGYDELLQAAGTDRSDFLEQVRDFQRRESTLGRPVCVVVTSRTVVTDHIRFPEGTMAVRLEPLDDRQIERLLDIWNAHNSAALRQRGLSPLPLDVLLRHRDLAEQPLLLLLLLLFDAGDNLLQRHSADFGRSALYEALLTGFAEREVAKHGAHLSGERLDRAADDELRRLEVVAMAMFARHRQSVTAEDLAKDLAVLLPGAGGTGDADRLLGRFFFVHEAQAVLDDRTHSVYEFLHSTFSEYLVARLIAGALGEAAQERRRAAQRRFGTPLDDGLLYAVASFAAVTGRAAVVEFLDDILMRHFAARPDDRDDYISLLRELLREAPYPQEHRSFGAYAPTRLPASLREAAFTANLVVLSVLVHPGPVPIEEVLPRGDENRKNEHRRVAGLWRGMSNSEWHGLTDTIRVRHLGHGTPDPRVVVQREDGSPVNVGECVAFELPEGRTAFGDPYGIEIPFNGVTSKLLRSTAIRLNGTAARQVLPMTPYLRHVSRNLYTWFADSGGEVFGELHELLELRFASVESDWPGRSQRYRRLLASRLLGPMELITLRQAAEDLTALPAGSYEYMALRGIVTAHLMGLTAVRTLPRVDPESAQAVLARLEPLLDAPEAFAHVRQVWSADDEPKGPRPTPQRRSAPYFDGNSAG